MPNICLYAELLTHIRQLTLHASLQTHGDETPRIDVSSDKTVITVVHGGESSSLWLPTQIAGTANVSFLTPQKTELTARVQIEDVAQWKEFDQNAVEAPWDSTELSCETSIKCKECRSQLLSSGKISAWKDLPSQDWADVMDLWYCHKPHEHQDTAQQKSAAEAKGFSARSKLAGVAGTGMVDLTSFVLHLDDCENIEIPDRPNENKFKPLPISCSSCKSIVGTFSWSDNLIRLQKAGLTVRRVADQDYVSFPASTFICAQLLSLIESSSLRKIVVYSTEEPDKHRAESQGANTGDRRNVQTEKNTSTLDARMDADNNISQLYTSDARDTSTAREARERSPQSIQLSSESSQARDLKATVEDEQSPSKKLKMASVLEGLSGGTARPPASIPPIPAKTGAKMVEKDGLSSEEVPGEDGGDNTESRGLLLWIFNPNIYYSSSLHPQNRWSTSGSRTASTAAGSETSAEPVHAHAQAHRAMKVFYKRIINPHDYLPSTGSVLRQSEAEPTSTTQPSSRTERLSTTEPPSSKSSQSPSPQNKEQNKAPTHAREEYEELPLSTDSQYQNLITTLQASTQILPEKARVFQDWNVGLLDRYEKVLTAEAVMAENPLTRKSGLPTTTTTPSASGSADSDADANANAETRTYAIPAGHQELYL